jgi:hypothetical protein
MSYSELGRRVVEDFKYDPLEFEKLLYKLPESAGRYKIRDELHDGFFKRVFERLLDIFMVVQRVKISLKQL